MSILQGHFAVLLVIAAPADVTVEALDAALAGVADELDLVVAVRALTDEAAPGSPAQGPLDSSGEPWTVAVHGADHTGIVHGITSALADAGGNVVDLATHLVGEPDAPVYVMTLRVMMPAGASGEIAAQRIRQVGADLGVHCTVLPDPADIL
jgi:glycine cleavage system transcriptional repressor